MTKVNNSRILFLSDTHVPYSHRDLIPFLTAVKKKYKPTRVISVGDMVDFHALSYHDSDPDLFSAGDELLEAIKILKPIYKLFPKVDICESNHGSMVYRKAKTNGVPRHCLKSYGEVLEAPDTWRWYPEIKININDTSILVRHQFKKNILQAAQFEGKSLIAGHFHEDFSISYASNSDNLIWAMTVGCLIDNKSLAFAYNKTFAKRPIIGLGMVINGQPMLIPMVLNKYGRWNKKLT